MLGANYKNHVGFAGCDLAVAITPHIAKSDPFAVRNLLAGAAGLSAAATLVLVTLWFQDYSQPMFLMVSLFVFPVPFACGLAVGLISPRRAILWAPLWSAIFAVLLFALLHGGIHDARVALSPWRLAFMGYGTVLAAIAGIIGQRASAKGTAVRAIVVFLALCCVAALAEYSALARQMDVFRSRVMPEVLLDVDRDYLRIPGGLDWEVERRPGEESYILSTLIDNTPLLIRVSASAPRVLGITYERRPRGISIRDTGSARRYLTKAGVREPLLRSLSEQAGGRRVWTASLEGTRLTLTSDGAMRMQALSDLLR